MNIKIESLDDAAKGSCPENLGFGNVFSDHMFTQSYLEGSGWADAAIKPFHSFTLHPASAVLHYGQEIFEGLKAYRRPDGKVNLFRPEKNVRRFNLSAERMMMPTVDEEFHLEAIRRLVEIDRRWVPSLPGSSMYLRPAMIATTPVLGLASSNSYLHFIIAGPVGAYFEKTLSPVSVFVSDVHRRAVKGGVGEAKTGGNYAASLLVSEQSKLKGFAQVLWLDAIEGKYIEEVGAMNICFVYKDGTIVTPELTGSILAGVTRDSLLQLAPKLGYEVKEQRLDINEILAGIKSGMITEAFGCGTAAAISPVGMLSFKDENFLVNNNETGPVVKHLYDELTSIQYGTKEDVFGWTSTI
jgi:branched-chain amino acid aminotransferase